MNNIEVTLSLSQQQGKDGYLFSRWSTNDTVLLKTTKSDPLPLDLKFNLELPGKIKIQILNPGADLGYIKLEKMIIARVPIDPSVLHNFCQHLSPSGKVSYGTMCNSTTEININLDFTDLIYWHMVHNRPTEYNK